MKMTVKAVKEWVSADSVGRAMDGTIKLRRGFFYRNGKTAEMWRDSVLHQLEKAGFEVEALDCGEVWKPFRGGASVASQSHWWVIVKEKVA